MIEISGAIATVRSLLDGVGIIRSGLKTMDDMQMNSKMIEIQNNAISVQGMIMDLIQKNNELQEKLKSIDDWEKEKSRYELVEFAKEKFVYSMKKEFSNGEPDHKICPHCFNNKIKSFLTLTEGSDGQSYSCFRCNYFIHNHDRRKYC